MSYATVQDVLFALDLDRAEPAEAAPRRARGRTRITGGAVQVAPRSRAQGSRRDESRRAAQAKAISS
jgi:hypothetical protein